MRISNKTSINKFIVEPYLTDGALTAKESNGFALIQQKVGVKGLRLLVDAKIGVGQEVVTFSRGGLVYIKEEFLHTQPFAKKILEHEDIGKFIIVDLQYAEFVDL